MDFRITGTCHAERAAVFYVGDQVGSMFVIPGGKLLIAHSSRLVAAQSQYVSYAVPIKIGQEIRQKEFVRDSGARKMRECLDPALVLYVRSDSKRIFRSCPACAIRDADKVRMEFFELVQRIVNRSNVGILFWWKDL